jgi:sRNA-binding protein
VATRKVVYHRNHLNVRDEKVAARKKEQQAHKQRWKEIQQHKENLEAPIKKFLPNKIDSPHSRDSFEIVTNGGKNEVFSPTDQFLT